MKQLLLSLLALTGILYAEAGVRWLNTNYDFGVWREAQGKRTGFARFVNEGPDTVIIASVRPSCGCTGADWYRDPVAPGDTAWVNFTYDPAGRPGKFLKTVKVYTNPGNVLQVINIAGTIIGKPATLDREYPYRVGDIRYNVEEYNFGQVEHGESRRGFIKCYNESSDTISPTVTELSGELNVRLSKPRVAPGELFTIGLFLFTRHSRAGTSSWTLNLGQGDKSAVITVDADIVPARKTYSEQELASAPHIAVPKEPVEITGGKPGGKVKFRFSIANEGKTALKMERVYSRAKAVTITKHPESLKPGKTGTVEGTIDLNDVDGPAFGYIIELISNDPLLPVATVRVTGQNPR